MKLKLYTKNNCPACVAAKHALEREGLEYELSGTLSEPEGMAAMLKDVEATYEKLGLGMAVIRSAPVLVTDAGVWTGADVVVAVEEREWED